MKDQIEELIKTAYTAFNLRNIDQALSTFHPDVEWPKAFEGGYIRGHEAIREYWTRQWSEINPNVDPVGITERPDKTYEVKIHQLVKSLDGNTLFDGEVRHIYTVADHLLRRMDIETD